MRDVYAVGAGAVYVADGRDIEYSNVVESDEEKTLALHDVTLHALSEGDSFDLRTRRPISRGAMPYIRTLAAAVGNANAAA